LLETRVAIQATTAALGKASASQPYQYMPGPSPLRARCIQKSSFPTAGW
jgi:hypothetical protein